MQLPWGLSCGQRDQCICVPATYPRCPTTQGHSRREDMELSRSCSLRSWEPNPTPENLLLTIKPQSLSPLLPLTRLHTCHFDDPKGPGEKLLIEAREEAHALQML